MPNKHSPPLVDKNLTTNIQTDKRVLRQKLRKLRRSLSAADQQNANRRLITQILRSKLLLKHKFIALYLGNDGELNPEPLIKLLWQQKKQVYLPVIQPFTRNRLLFCRILPKTKLVKNKFGILEPALKDSPRLPKQFLSLVMMPLVAFDKQGNRMGMGGGFYDRSFAYKTNKKRKPNHIKPKLVGVAHAFQEQENLAIEPWDVPLEAILTDKYYHLFKPRA